MARILSITDDGALQAATEVLAGGDVIGLPTETVYGLAADATNGVAVARIFEVKGRPRFNPLICHVADITMAERYVVFDPTSRKLAEAFWPGALTLVLPLRAEAGIASLTTAGLTTLAVRAPAGFAHRLIAAYDRPLAAPSANTSGRISPTRADHVEADIGAKLPLILDAGAAPVGLESTIIKVEGDAVTLLRPGGVPAAAIEAVIGRPVARREKAGAIEAPGMMASHYAPDAPLRMDAQDVKTGEVLIDFGGQNLPGKDKAAAVFDLSPAGELAEAAANLFDLLKRADKISSSGIAVAPIPMDGLGEAINDRLARAAAPRTAISTDEAAHG